MGQAFLLYEKAERLRGNCGIPQRFRKKEEAVLSIFSVVPLGGFAARAVRLASPGNVRRLIVAMPPAAANNWMRHRRRGKPRGTPPPTRAAKHRKRPPFQTASSSAKRLYVQRAQMLARSIRLNCRLVFGPSPANPRSVVLSWPRPHH